MKKKKLLLCACLLLYVCFHFMYYFGQDKVVDGTNGLYILVNPLTVLGLFLIVYGIVKNSNSRSFAVLGASMLVLIEIFYLLKWPVPTINHHINMAYSLEIAHLGFYLSFLTSVAMLILSIYINRTKITN